MSASRRLSRLTWYFPLVIIVLAGALSIASRWAIPKKVLETRFRQAYGLILDRLELMGFPDIARWLSSDEIPRSAIPQPKFALPPGYTASNSGARMIFAQLADGIIPGTNRYYRTGFMLVNDSTYDAKGTIEFLDDAGKPLTLTLEGSTASSFSLSIPKGTARRYTTSGSGVLKVGWALAQTDQPITGTSSFTILDTTGKVQGDVGVSDSALGTSFTILARYIAGTTDIGLALINPSSTDTNNLKLELINMDGSKQTETSLNLGPKAHIARFLGELFPTGMGSAFKGSVIVTSSNGKPFGGITLRITGDIMTSLPMVAPPKSTDTRTRLAFPQVADGLLGQLKYKTSVLLFNNTSDTASGSVEFFNSDGTPMSVTIDTTTAASHNFTLKSRALGWLITTAAGNAKIGWARVKMDKPMSGAAIFHVYDKSDKALAEVGVAAATPSKGFNLIADSMGFFDTGIALANPSESGDASKIKLSLYDKTGVLKSEANVTLEAQKHQAQFLTQIFPSAQNVSEFEGLIKVTSDEDVVPLSLRSIDEKLTSVPTLAPLHGFAPTSVLTPAQSLAGTAPAVRWQLHQDGNDLALSTLKISLPNLGLRTSSLVLGENIGYGAFIADLSSLQAGASLGGIVNLTVTKTSPVEFQGLASALYLGTGTLLVTGKLSGTESGNLTIEATPQSLLPGGWNSGIAVDLDVYLRSDLIVVPGSVSSVTVATNYTSISTKQDDDSAYIVRQSTQPLSFVAQASAKTNLTSIQPMLLVPTNIITLKGTNFGSSPQISFTGANNTNVLTSPIAIAADGLSVMVPTGVVDGPVQIDNGQGLGNSYQAKTWFAPALQIKRAAPGTSNETPLAFIFRQAAMQLGLSGFQIDMYYVDRTLSGLAAGTVVGSYNVTTQIPAAIVAENDMVVESSSADKAVLKIVKKGSSSSSPSARLTIQRITDTPAGLSFMLAPASADVLPSFSPYPVQTDIVLSGLPLKLAASTGTDVSWTAAIKSTPAGAGGAGTALRVKITK